MDSHLGLALSCVTVLVLAPACAEREISLAEVPTEDVELRDYCPERDASPLTQLATAIGPVVGGPCGDLVYKAGDDQFWYRPGVGSVAIDAQPWSTQFAPTGHLLAWERDSGDGLVLADTRSGELVDLPGVHSFGFAPVPGSDHGADLWTCRAAVLELAGPVDTGLLSEGVNCDSVRSSSGSARVVFADETGQVFIADLETAELWPVDDEDYQRGSFNAQGYMRDDWLWIDHDGRVVVHQETFWEHHDDVDADWQIIDRMRVFGDGEALADWAADVVPFAVHQRARRGAPVLLRPGGGLTAVLGAQRHDHAGPLDAMEIDASGRALLADEQGRELLRLSRDGASLEVVAEDVEALTLRVSSSGAWAVVEQIDPACVDDLDACAGAHTNLALWNEDHGLLPARASGYDWTPIAISDAGELVTLGRVVGDTMSELIVFDAGLERLATRAMPQSSIVRTVEVLDDGRVLAEVFGDGAGQLLLIDPAAAEGERINLVPNNTSIANTGVFVDGLGRNLAFVDIDEQGQQRLVAGAMPSK